MGKRNKTIRTELESIYGKECMFKKARIAERLVQIGITGYKKFVEEKHYKRKKIRQLEGNITLHHLQHEAEDGPTTVENGALVNELAHRYLHSLPRNQEEIINDMLREYKQTAGLFTGQLVITEDKIEVYNPLQVQLDFQFEEDCIEIKAFDNTEYDRKFNRAKVKKETQSIVDEGIQTYYDEMR